MRPTEGGRRGAKPATEPGGAGSAGQESPRLRARAFVSGRVQGVCFRACAGEEAERLGVGGWVRNLADGRVEVLVEGERSAVEAMLAWCGRGPSYARVDRVEVSWEDPPEGIVSFRITR